MAEKISLKKNKDDPDAQIQAVNEKLDFLINEIREIKIEMNRLQASNDDKMYKLDSRIYSVCSSLKEQVYKLESKVYEGNSDLRNSIYHLDTRVYQNAGDLKEGIKNLQNKTTYSRFLDNILPWSPLIIAGGTIWVMVMHAILS